MNPKTIITLAVGITCLVITAWKGPSTWGMVAAGGTGIALLIGTLTMVPSWLRADAALVAGALSQGGPISAQPLSVQAAHARIVAALGSPPAAEDVKVEDETPVEGQKKDQKKEVKPS